MKQFRTVIFLFMMLLAGCGEQSGKVEKAGVDAVVNGVEITKRQIDFYSRQYPRLNENSQDAEKIRRSILADIVKTELLAQKARKTGIQKTPEYSIALYEAQKKALAGLLEERLYESQVKYDLKDIKDIIENNPHYFAGRKLFVYDEIFVASAENTLLNNLDKLISDGTRLDGLEDELRKKGINHQRMTKAITTDKIPPELVNALERLQTGVPQVIRVQNSFAFILQLHGSYSQPLKGKQAEVVASNMIESNMRSAALSKEINSLLNNSSITYFGEYAKKSHNKDIISEGLPMPEQKKALKVIYKKYLLGGFSATSVLLSVLIFTAGMNIIKDEGWTPQLLKSRKEDIALEKQYEIPLELHILHKLFLVVFGLIILLFLGLELMYLLNALPGWGVLISIVIGIIAGIGASQLFRLKYLSDLSDNVYIFIIVFLTIPLAFLLLLIVRLSGL